MRCDSRGPEHGLDDDPELTCRLPGLEDRSPIRIVADTRLSIPSQVKLVKTAEQVPVWMLSTRNGWVSAGITVIDCRQTPDGWVDFPDAMERLAKEASTGCWSRAVPISPRVFLRPIWSMKCSSSKARLSLARKGLMPLPIRHYQRSKSALNPPTRKCLEPIL